MVKDINMLLQKASKAKYIGLMLEKKRLFEVVVASTMSSGKSTLINTLVSEDILPTRNQVCTAKTIHILDNDRAKEITAHIINDKGAYKRIKHDPEAFVELYNDNNEYITDMIIECDIKGVRNIKKSLVLVDTPGTNNASDASHEKMTREYIDGMEEGLILYIINATQVGTDDDKRLLSAVYDKVSKSENVHVLFVVNKMDKIDVQKENPHDFITGCKEYIKSIGFENINIVSVSAAAARVIQKAINNQPMSEMDTDDFEYFIKKFKSHDYDMSVFRSLSSEPDQTEEIVIDGIAYSAGELKSALSNTGIPALERMIGDYMINSIGYKSPSLHKVKDNKEAEAKEKKELISNMIDIFRGVSHK